MLEKDIDDAEMARRLYEFIGQKDPDALAKAGQGDSEAQVHQPARTRRAEDVDSEGGRGLSAGVEFRSEAAEK
jgi:hypothetical protein